eukprot:TRINITY_DN5666_c0_g2_i3.p1 TRINITY_DN5666_c0_g2~~TRINITY_DN5666_c0_g2_i3.p1  ORF type:complete len:782 (-),score=170.25 TRINITY_DN5666_c0_g2_i3:1007-3352(-)
METLFPVEDMKGSVDALCVLLEKRARRLLRREEKYLFVDLRNDLEKWMRATVQLMKMDVNEDKRKILKHTFKKIAENATEIVKITGDSLNIQMINPSKCNWEFGVSPRLSIPKLFFLLKKACKSNNEEFYTEIVQSIKIKTNTIIRESHWFNHEISDVYLRSMNDSELIKNFDKLNRIVSDIAYFSYFSDNVEKLDDISNRYQITVTMIQQEMIKEELLESLSYIISECKINISGDNNNDLMNKATIPLEVEKIKDNLSALKQVIEQDVHKKESLTKGYDDLTSEIGSDLLDYDRIMNICIYLIDIINLSTQQRLLKYGTMIHLEMKKLEKHNTLKDTPVTSLLRKLLDTTKSFLSIIDEISLKFVDPQKLKTMADSLRGNIKSVFNTFRENSNDTITNYSHAIHSSLVSILDSIGISPKQQLQANVGRHFLCADMIKNGIINNNMEAITSGIQVLKHSIGEQYFLFDYLVLKNSDSILDTFSLRFFTYYLEIEEKMKGMLSRSNKTDIIKAMNTYLKNIHLDFKGAFSIILADEIHIHQKIDEGKKLVASAILNMNNNEKGLVSENLKALNIMIELLVDHLREDQSVDNCTSEKLSSGIKKQFKSFVSDTLEFMKKSISITRVEETGSTLIREIQSISGSDFDLDLTESFDMLEEKRTIELREISKEIHRLSYGTSVNQFCEEIASDYETLSYLIEKNPDPSEIYTRIQHMAEGARKIRDFTQNFFWSGQMEITESLNIMISQFLSFSLATEDELSMSITTGCRLLFSSLSEVLQLIAHI